MITHQEYRPQVNYGDEVELLLSYKISEDETREKFKTKQLFYLPNREVVFEACFSKNTENDESLARVKIQILFSKSFFLNQDLESKKTFNPLQVSSDLAEKIQAIALEELRLQKKYSTEDETNHSIQDFKPKPFSNLVDSLELIENLKLSSDSEEELPIDLVNFFADSDSISPENYYLLKNSLELTDSSESIEAGFLLSDNSDDGSADSVNENHSNSIDISEFSEKLEQLIREEENPLLGDFSPLETTQSDDDQVLRESHSEAAYQPMQDFQTDELYETLSQLKLEAGAEFQSYLSKLNINLLN